MINKEKISAKIIFELKRKGADGVVVSFSTRKRTQIKFVNNGIASVTNWDLTSLNIFMDYKKRVVSTNILSFDDMSIKNAINMLVTLARLSAENADFNGIAGGPFKYRKIKNTYDKKIEYMGNKGIDIAMNSINLALNEGAKRASGIFEYESAENYLKSSENAEAQDKGTSAYLSLRAFTDKDSSGHKTACSRMLSGLQYKSAARKAGQFSVQGKNPEKIEAGRYDLVFDPMAFAVILDNVAQATSIFSVEAGLSFFKNMLNKKVADEKVTLFDDGRLENGYGTSMFDDEGVPTRRNTVIDAGILKTYLHNYSTALRYKTRTTANAGLISPEPWNTVLKPGRMSIENILKTVDKGLYITNVWYTRYQNHATGDFSTIPRDSIFFISNGRITKSVKDIRISDNMVNVLRNIADISSRPEQVIGWETEKPVVTPFVKVKNINVTKSV